MLSKKSSLPQDTRSSLVLTSQQLITEYLRTDQSRRNTGLYGSMSFDNPNVEAKYKKIKADMQKSGSDLGGKYIFGRTREPPNDSSLNYVDHRDQDNSFQYFQDSAENQNDLKKYVDVAFRNASDSFFKDQARRPGKAEDIPENQSEKNKRNTQSTGNRLKQSMEYMKDENKTDSDANIYQNNYLGGEESQKE